MFCPDVSAWPRTVVKVTAAQASVGDRLTRRTGSAGRSAPRSLEGIIRMGVDAQSFAEAFARPYQGERSTYGGQQWKFGSLLIGGARAAAGPHARSRRLQMY